MDTSNINIGEPNFGTGFSASEKNKDRQGPGITLDTANPSIEKEEGLSSAVKSESLGNLKEILQKAESKVDECGQKVIQAVNSLGKTLHTLFEGLSKLAKNFMETLTSLLRKLYEAIRSIIDRFTQLHKTGKDIADNVKENLQNFKAEISKIKPENI
ncbi:MAG: hypothetical protein LBN94_00785 [Puniceicoccales bacterium]|jgi:ABC-type transporter Mla subunit MlaD|nr:hypothetical protein [Puniceicoccales bacterium]